MIIKLKVDNTELSPSPNIRKYVKGPFHSFLCQTLWLRYFICFIWEWKLNWKAFPPNVLSCLDFTKSGEWFKLQIDFVLCCYPLSPLCQPSALAQSNFYCMIWLHHRNDCGLPFLSSSPHYLFFFHLFCLFLCFLTHCTFCNAPCFATCGKHIQSSWAMLLACFSFLKAYLKELSVTLFIIEL